MPIIIKVTGLKEVQNMIIDLGSNLKEEVGKKGIWKIAESLRRRVRYRYTTLGYGKGRTTGLGWKEMQIRQTEKGAIFEILAPYLSLIEKGVRSHWVSLETIRTHMEHPGSTIFRKATGPFEAHPVWWTQRGPFVKPALMTLRKDIPNILKPYTQRAIRKSRKGGRR